MRSSNPQPKTQKTTSKNRGRHQSTHTLAEHIGELRRRLAWSVLLGIAVGALVYTYHDFFVTLVMSPLGDHKLIYLTPAGGFNFIFMVTFYVTGLLVMPFLVYQIYAFLKPAIPSTTRKVSIGVMLAATVLLVAGSAFGYIFAVPAGLDFLMRFAGEYVEPSLTADSYLRFILGYVFGIGVLFELPLLLLFWHWIHPLTPSGLLRSERYIIVGAFIVAGIISPSPDALTQAIIAVPLIIVYQIGVIAVLISIRKRRRALRSESPVAATSLVQEVSNEQEVRTAPTRGPLPQPARQTSALSRPVRSIDGIKASRNSPRLTIPPAPPRNLEIAPRTRTISDFYPARRQAIDIVR